MAWFADLPGNIFLGIPETHGPPVLQRDAFGGMMNQTFQGTYDPKVGLLIAQGSGKTESCDDAASYVGGATGKIPTERSSSPWTCTGQYNASMRIQLPPQK